MAPEAVVAERTYLLLKRDVVSGRFAPGMQIIERRLAAEYGSSIAPFRDGAQRLVGEGLLEAGTGGGYRVPTLSEAGLKDLYDWHSHLIRLALKEPAASLVFDPLVLDRASGADAEELAKSATAMFRAIAMRSSNGEVGRALLAANDRLHAIRLRESYVLPNLDDELRAVMIATSSSRGQDRLAALWAYHRRRLRRVSSLARILI